MTSNLLEIEKLNVDYLLDRGEFRAVKDVSFNIGKGEIFGLPANPAAARAQSPMPSRDCPRPRPGSAAVASAWMGRIF